jgi:hypothetical protein
MMDLGEALERIDAIHSHLARSEPYRGYRPAALALSGLGGLLAAAAQPILFTDDPGAFVAYWVAVAVLCGAVAGGATLYGYLAREDDDARRRTRVALRQFLPCLFAGAVVTAALARESWRPLAVGLLPGLWALLFGLGSVASLPYLPRGACLVAGWYLLAGVALLGVDGAALGGWAVGVPFGVGQVLAAVVLCRERTGDESP